MIGRAQVLRLLLLVIIFLGAAVQSGEIPYQRVLLMGLLNSAGRYPQTRLLLGPDGVFYGTTYQGGVTDGGTIFAIKPDGTAFRVMHQFTGPAVTGTAGDGLRPYADLVWHSDGFIYGTTERGGTNDAGTIFKIKPDGRGYQVLFRFTGATGYLPRGHMLEGSDGFFYSTTQVGGPFGAGTVFKIGPDGTGFRILHNFSTSAGDGIDCDAGLTLGSDGRLYGVSSSGFDPTRGAIFGLNQDGSGYVVLHRFNGTNGYEPNGPLLELADGALYGTTELSNGGGGVIYKINKDGSGFQVLQIMGDPVTEPVPGWLTSQLILGDDGALYGTGLWAVFKIQPDGSGVQMLHSFYSAPDGLSGRGVVFGPDGALYGATQFGGSNDAGVLYRIQPDGSQYSVLHRFQHTVVSAATPRTSLSQTEPGVYFGTTEAGGTTNAGTMFTVRSNGTDARILFSFGVGANAVKLPNRLCFGGDGFLYGTAAQGGPANVGAVFRIGLNGSNYSVLSGFGGSGHPRAAQAGLIMDATGWLYGTSFGGGTASVGTVYKIHKDTGELIVLRSLTTAEGSRAQSELVQVGDLLYGTASLGGPQNMGMVFRIDVSGSNYTVLHNFTGGAEGQNPMSGLMMGSDGRLYGTTSRLVPNFGGCIYRLNVDGSGFQSLRAFSNAVAQPRLPRPMLVEAPDGFLYGATQSGGAADKGTIFRIGKDGDGFAILHEFGTVLEDGQTPSAGFTPVGDGSFLGVTEAGGPNGTGSIFRFDPVEARLRISLTATSAELRWPASSTIDHPETTTVGEFDWRPSGVSVSRNGAENEATVSRPAEGRLYRVKRVWE